MQHGYKFEPQNPFLAEPSPTPGDLPYQTSTSIVAALYQRGQAAVTEGALGQAILLFEAGVQRDEQAGYVWEALGHCQAENEQVIFTYYVVVRCLLSW